jgi:hypothetical protein
MKEITTHHDGHGLNESIVVQATDGIGVGGAYHRYEFITGRSNGEFEVDLKVGYLQFQEGPRNEVGSIPGVVEGAVLAVIEDRLASFQAGPYPSDEGETALFHVREAMWWLKRRADARAARGVLGTSTK